jgi:hypothetical protein
VCTTQCLDSFPAGVFSYINRDRNDGYNDGGSHGKADVRMRSTTMSGEVVWRRRASQLTLDELEGTRSERTRHRTRLDFGHACEDLRARAHSPEKALGPWSTGGLLTN